VPSSNPTQVNSERMTEKSWRAAIVGFI
jgi:hypothetical protein